MAIFGWVMLCVIVLCVTAGLVLLALNHIGTWTIGGVPNSLGTRMLSFAVLIVVGYIWNVVISMAPFTVTLN